MKDTMSKKKKSVNSKSVSKSVKKEDSQVLSKSTKKVKRTRHGAYLSYNTRLVFYIILLIVFFALSLFCARKTLIKENTKPIAFTEQEIVDYKVYLKDNDFYTEKFLPKNRAYIANLIDYIDVDMKYIFHIDDLTKMNVDYKVVGELVIENSAGSSRYFEKEYTIVDSKHKNIEGMNEFLITENVKVNYDYYNELANRFRASYGVETNSYLRLYLQLNKGTDKNLSYTISEGTRVDSVTIPLSERAIEIKINSANNISSRFVVPKPSIRINTPYLAGEVLAFFIAAFALIRAIGYITMMIKSVSPYDKFVNKILKDYDRLIIEIETNINLDDYNVIEVSKFTELLDVRDNLKMPINYYNIAKHEKGIFYIKNNDDIYLLTLKNVDLKGKKLKEIC